MEYFDSLDDKYKEEIKGAIDIFARLWVIALNDDEKEFDDICKMVRDRIIEIRKEEEQTKLGYLNDDEKGFDDICKMVRDRIIEIRKEEEQTKLGY